MKMLKRDKILMAVLLPPILVLLVGCCCLIYSILPPELKPIMATVAIMIPSIMPIFVVWSID